MNALFLIGFAVGIVQIQAQACADSSTNCVNFKKNGFCNSTFYTTEIKIATCARTCDLCGASTGSPSTTPSSTAPTTTRPTTTPTTTRPTTTPPTTSSRPTTAGSTCSDNSTNCANFARNGFCTNPFYSEAQRRTSCAKTCNLC